MKNRYLLFFFVVLFPTVLLAQPQNMPVLSRPDIFTFFDKSSAAIPAGSAANSSGILLLDVFSSPVRHHVGTAFVIRTFRDDDQVCVCMSGHQVQDMLQGANVPTPPATINVDADAYMNYFGVDELDNSEAAPDNYKTDVTEFRMSFLATAQLVAYYQGPNPSEGPDAALFLINRKQLPLNSFASLGYDFEDNTAAWSGYFYNLSHPHGYPMRISDNVRMTGTSTNIVSVTAPLPNAIARGSSGSPLITRPAAGAGNGVVRGILSTAPYLDSFKSPGLDGGPRVYPYSDHFNFSKIGILESAIREHCWNSRDRATIASTGSYKQAAIVNNARPALDQNQTVNSATDISGSAAGFTESTTDGRKVTQLLANNCTIVSTASGTLALPVTYPGSTTPWRVVVAAKQVNVNPGFSYTASGSSELDLTTLEVYARTSGATGRLAADADTASSAATAGNLPGFKLYPNPSPDGVFYIEVPAAVTSVVYKGSVLSVDGKAVQQLNDLQSGQKVTLNLSHLAHDVYILSVQTSDGRAVFTAKITF